MQIGLSKDFDQVQYFCLYVSSLDECYNISLQSNGLAERAREARLLSEELRVDSTDTKQTVTDRKYFFGVNKFLSLCEHIYPDM